MAHATRLLNGCYNRNDIVRLLANLMWITPVFVGFSALVATKVVPRLQESAPLTSGTLSLIGHAHAATGAAQTPRAGNLKTAAEKRLFGELVAFASTPGEQKFSFSLTTAANKPSPAIKTVVRAQNRQRVPQFTAKAVSPGPIDAGQEDGAAPFQVRKFRNVRVVSANMIEAEGVRIRMTNFGLKDPDAKCKRIDGVVLACSERARSRLEVLVMARTVTCKLFGRANRGTYAGRCKAGQIDIASDLIAQKLATPSS